MSQKIKIVLLTGFLGSGKSTLLSKILHDSDFHSSAVLINEIGDVEIDHTLIRQVLNPKTVILNSGCVCCSLQSDLVSSLQQLFLDQVRQKVPEFHTVFIETTGLAYPAPIIQTLMNDPMVLNYYQLDKIITVFDSQFGKNQLDQYIEVKNQMIVADIIYYSKTDLNSDTFENLNKITQALNPFAETVFGDFFKLKQLLHTKINHNNGKINYNLFEHSDVNVLNFKSKKPININDFITTYKNLQKNYGESLLRMKATLLSEDKSAVYIFQTVNHVFYPIEIKQVSDNFIEKSECVIICRKNIKKTIQQEINALFKIINIGF